MTTKEKIIEEALTLFSQKGFKGTSVKNIADAVGIKDSSLYKHFHSKQEIFDTILEEMRNRMEHMSFEMGLPPDNNVKNQATAYGSLTVAAMRKLSRKILVFYLKDDFISRFWRMANMEQYRNSEVYEIFRHIFMEESLIYQKALFQEMIEEGYFISADASVMAMNFYTPIFFLLNKYAGRSEEYEEALMVLDKQVLEFCRIYKK